MWFWSLDGSVEPMCNADKTMCLGLRESLYAKACWTHVSPCAMLDGELKTACHIPSRLGGAITAVSLHEEQGEASLRPSLAT